MQLRAPTSPRSLAVLAFVLLVVRRTTMAAERILEHPTRIHILEFLREHPLSTKTQIRDGVTCAWGTTHYHLEVLGRERLVKKMRVSGRYRYFLPEVSREHAASIGALLHGRARDLAECIVRRPGAVQRELTQVLEMSRKMLRTYVDRLVQAGLITEAREGRFRVYHPSPQLVSLLESTTPDARRHAVAPWTGDPADVAEPLELPPTERLPSAQLVRY